MSKSPSSFQRHHARVFGMLIFLIIFNAILGLCIGLFCELVFHFSLDYNLLNLSLAFMMYMCWVSNVRFGWMENLILDRKEYPLMSVWFEKVC